jgi:hypothetical protein
MPLIQTRRHHRPIHLREPQRSASVSIPLQCGQELPLNKVGKRSVARSDVIGEVLTLRDVKHTSLEHPGNLGKGLINAANFFVFWRSGHITGSMCISMPVWHSAALRSIVPRSTGFHGSNVIFGSPPRLEFLGFHPLIALSKIRSQETHAFVRVKFHWSMVGMKASQSTSRCRPR